MEKITEYVDKKEMMEQTNEVDLEKELGITEVKLSSSEGLVFFAGCHCSNGNKSVSVF